LSSDVPFGVVFGELVRRYRRAKKLTQETLAAEVLGSSDRKGDISRLENGKVRQPQLFTVRRLAEYLDISSADIDELCGLARELEVLRQECGTLAASLGHVNTLKRRQLQAIAIQFEIENALTLPEQKLRKLIQSKSEEYRAYRDQIDLIDERSVQSSNLKYAASNAAEELDLVEVERLCLIAHSLELELAEETAELRIRNALLRNRVQQAFQIISATAASFSSVDSLGRERKWRELGKLLFFHGTRYGGDAHVLLEGVLPTCLDFPVEEDRSLWGNLQNNLGLVLSYNGSRLGGKVGQDRMLRAISAFEAALEAFSVEGYRDDWSRAQNNLGNAYWGIAARAWDPQMPNSLLLAIDAYEAALEVRNFETHPEEWSRTQTNLGISLLLHGSRVDESARKNFYMRSIQAFTDALRVRTREATPELWAETQIHLSRAETKLSEQQEKHYQKTLVRRAIGRQKCALRVLRSRQEPILYGLGQSALGETLNHYFILLSENKREARLLEAKTVLIESQTRITVDDYPTMWAKINEQLSVVQLRNCVYFDPSQREKNREIGIKYAKKALSIFLKETMPFDHNRVMDILRDLKNAPLKR